MGWYVPVTGPDAGRLVRRDSPDATLSAEPPDEVALDAAIPGRAAVRELYAPTHAAADRARRGAEGAADVLYRHATAAGDSITRAAARDRVNLARQRAAAKRG